MAEPDDRTVIRLTALAALAGQVNLDALKDAEDLFRRLLFVVQAVSVQLKLNHSNLP